MKRTIILLLFTILFLSVINQLNAQQIPTAEQYVGFKMGSDGKLARWDK